MADLNRNELEALRVLWDHGPLKPAEIQSHFGWPIENATLRSVLRVLVEKGHARREKTGKAYQYEAVVSQRGLFTNMTRRMAQVFTGGSTVGLIAQLIRHEALTPEEIDELRRIASEKAVKPGGRGERP